MRVHAKESQLHQPAQCNYRRDHYGRMTTAGLKAVQKVGYFPPTPPISERSNLIGFCEPLGADCQQGKPFSR
jgi:hypothetical protein